MEPLNRIELRGRVGSHRIAPQEGGRWSGWFDLHVSTNDIYGVYQPMVFDCYVKEDGRNVKGLGAGIGGMIVNVRGRLLQYPGISDDYYFIQVTHLTVVGGPKDELKVPDPPKTEADRRLEKGGVV